jgi:Bacterial protein of unknown function (DUF885)
MRFVALLAFLPTLAAVAQAPAGRPDLRTEIERYNADQGLLQRRYDTPMSAKARERMRSLHRAELTALDAMDFESLGRDARVDWNLLHGYCQHELQLLDRGEKEDAAIAELLPFAPPLVALHEAWRRLEETDSRAAAATLADATAKVKEVHDRLASGALDTTSPPHARRAVRRIDELRRAVGEWFRFRDGYDPDFTWWCKTPFDRLDQGLQGLRQDMEKRLVDKTGDASLVGNPIGEEALEQELQYERIPYSPAELVQIAEKEFAWCDAEMLKASRELDCGDDWKRAMAKVKEHYVAPGSQPGLVRRLANEAIAFVEQKDLVTIPDLAKECWRMSMMSPRAQRVNPFFLGGEEIQVSYPTESMTEDEKLQSLRSNNEHFSRATVFHELIPGHWLQQYMQARWRPYRGMFETPFWIEGWALYWEMRLYDLGFPRGPEDRVGMLYWRKHRCARIVFSLNFHLGKWTPRQCVDYLVDRVGHEPAAAEGEVRRSISGGYGPLYQCAYMLGGLQIRALQAELVGKGKRSEREFHDAVLQQNAIPIALIRAALGDELPGKDAGSDWRFYDLQGK